MEEKKKKRKRITLLRCTCIYRQGAAVNVSKSSNRFRGRFFNSFLFSSFIHRPARTRHESGGGGLTASSEDKHDTSSDFLFLLYRQMFWE